jgi:hypothetical protein
LFYPNQWQVTPETACLLQHWRDQWFRGVGPFFGRGLAGETTIWLTEVAPQSENGKRLLDHLASANRDANPELMRLALKLAAARPSTGNRPWPPYADVSRPLGEHPQGHAHVRVWAYKIGLPSARKAGAYRTCSGQATRL